ncbi:MAG: hypothetical protein V1898_02700 [Patescibacteria group bacterium]
MSFRTYLLFAILLLVVFSAAVLGIKQKVSPEKTLVQGIETTEALEKQIQDNMDNMASQIVATDANTVASSANTNVSNNEIFSEQKQQVADKFGLNNYPGVLLEKKIFSIADTNLSSALLSTTDSETAVLIYYKDQMGEDVKEIKNLAGENADQIETSLILFSADGGQGELSVKIWPDIDLEKTYINLTINNDFLDPKNVVSEPENVH